jgi:hypothetical protein
VLGKSRFWQQHRNAVLTAEQLKLVNRLLDGGADNFEDGITAAKYGSAAHVSKATATRHLADLLEKGLLLRLPRRRSQYALSNQLVSRPGTACRKAQAMTRNDIGQRLRNLCDGLRDDGISCSARSPGSCCCCS